MPITDPVAVKFANEQCRIMADLIETMDRTAQQFMQNIVGQQWEANPDVVAAQDADPINDGSQRSLGANADGRKPVTKVNVAELKYVAEQILAAMAISDRRAVVNRWSVNASPRF